MCGNVVYMSEVTVSAVQPVLGLDEGSVVTIECTRRVQAAVDAGALVLVDAETTEMQNDRGEVVRVEPAVPVRPVESASKAAWSAYADAIGVDHDGLTKDQIIAAVAADDLLDSDPED